MKLKKCVIIILLMFFALVVLRPNEIFAAKKTSKSEKSITDTLTGDIVAPPNPSDTTSAPGIEDIKSGMKNVGDANSSNSKIASILNVTIKLIQVAGTGIALITITMLRYKIHASKFSRKGRYQKTSNANCYWLCCSVCSS